MSHRRELAILVAVPMVLGLVIAFWSWIVGGVFLTSVGWWLLRRAYPASRGSVVLPRWLESFALLSGARTARRYVSHLERQEKPW